MICSFSNQFLFIKSRKVGGTSVEIALSRWCGPDDIITPISPKDELLRVPLGRTAQNYCSVKFYEQLYGVGARLGSASWLRMISSRARRFTLFHNHMSLQEVRGRIDPRRLEGLTMFTIERHPYEKALSQACHWKARRAEFRDSDLGAVIDAVIEAGRYVNYPLYFIDGKPAVHRVIRYEHLRDELNAILRELRLGPLGELPLAKSGFRPDPRPARELLSPSQKARILRDAKPEFDCFGYEP